MRGDDTFRVGEEGMSVGEGFRVSDIDGGAEETLRLERFQEFLLALASPVCASLCGRGMRQGGWESRKGGKGGGETTYPMKSMCRGQR